MTGHGAAVLALWTRLLVVRTLEACHYSSLFSIFFLSFLFRLGSLRWWKVVRSGGLRKEKVESKARKSAGVPNVEHVGDELSELESPEQVAHVGIASSSKLEAVGELIPTGKTDIRLDTSEISDKCEVGLNPRFSSIFAENPPAERLSSSFPCAGSASGSAHESRRRTGPASVGVL